MIKKIQVKIVGIRKSGRNAKEVIDLVHNDKAIPENDIGQYLVGVFACRPLTFDYKSYDPVKKSQWSHCIYKKKWEAALHGKDDFTDDEKSLILAGEDLLKNYTKGVWNEAIAQPHVRKLLESWKNSNLETSSIDEIETLNLQNNGVTRKIFNDACNNLKKSGEKVTLMSICDFIKKSYDTSRFESDWETTLKDKISEWKLEDENQGL